MLMDDEKIIALFFERDDKAIQETQAKYGRLCYSVAINILGVHEDAEECVNDAYLGVWNSIPPNRPSSFSAFLLKTTRNLSLKRLRFRTAEKRGGGQATLSFDELAECIPDSFDIEKELEASELTALINAFLRALPQTERRIFICRYWYCDSVADISKSFGFGEGKVKMILMRTRNKLRDLLSEREVFK